MTREKFWKKWGPSDEKGLFLIDLNELIVKHQAPYISALDNISCEIENLTNVEVTHAQSKAKSLK
jgi:hypothetical protein